MRAHTPAPACTTLCVPKEADKAPILEIVHDSKLAGHCGRHRNLAVQTFVMPFSQLLMVQLLQVLVRTVPSSYSRSASDEQRACGSRTFWNGRSPAKCLGTQQHQNGRHHLMLQRSTNGQAARRPEGKSTLGTVGIIPVVRTLQGKQQSSSHTSSVFVLRSPVGRSKPTVWRFLSHRLLRP